MADKNELKKPEEIEAALIAQEHRFTHILFNFITSRSTFEKNDPRRKSALQALIWRFFSPSTVATSGIGLTAFFGVIFAYQANSLLKEQNQLSESARRSAIVFELTSILDGIDEELDEANIQKDAVKTRDKNEEAGTTLIPENRPRRRDIENPPMYRLSDRLTGRIAALSRSLRPYRYLSNDGRLIEKPLSPERAQLLLSLVDSGIDMEEINHSSVTFDDADLRDTYLVGYDFTHIKLMKADLQGSKINGGIFDYARLDSSNIQKADLSSAKLRWTTLTNANLNGADLTGADLDGAVLDYSDLTNTKLSGAKNWDRIVSIKGAKLGTVIDPPSGFKEWALAKGALDESSQIEEPGLFNTIRTYLFE